MCPIAVTVSQLRDYKYHKSLNFVFDLKPQTLMILDCVASFSQGFAEHAQSTEVTAGVGKSPACGTMSEHSDC